MHLIYVQHTYVRYSAGIEFDPRVWLTDAKGGGEWGLERLRGCFKSMGYMAGVDPFLMNRCLPILVSFGRFFTIIIIIQGEISGPEWRESGAR